MVRHGQASFGTSDYDRLTPVGVAQAEHLGRWLAQNDVRLDAIVYGPRLRQSDTARHMLAAGRAAGAKWPDGELIAALDEYPAEAIMRASLPALLAAADEEARAVFGGDPLAVATDARRFQRLFERVMRSWVAGELAHALGPTETFAQFATRVRGALDDLMAGAGRGKTIAVVTSAGPTSIAAQMALELDDAVALKLSWVVANTGITDLKWRDSEMTLTAFNGVGHLPPSLVTYR